MSVDNSLATSLNAFSVEPSEDTLITLTYGQLRDLITSAVKESIEPLQDRIESLESTAASQQEEMAAMKADEKLDHDDIRDLFDAVTALELRPSTAPPAPPAPPKGEKSIARIAKIEEVLKSRGPTTLKQLEHILEISPKEMNRLLGRLDMRRYELHSRPGDDREKVLRFKAQIR